MCMTKTISECCSLHCTSDDAKFWWSHGDSAGHGLDKLLAWQSCIGNGYSRRVPYMHTLSAVQTSSSHQCTQVTRASGRGGTCRSYSISKDLTRLTLYTCTIQFESYTAVMRQQQSSSWPDSVTPRLQQLRMQFHHNVSTCTQRAPIQIRFWILEHWRRSSCSCSSLRGYCKVFCPGPWSLHGYSKIMAVTVAKAPRIYGSDVSYSQS